MLFEIMDYNKRGEVVATVASNNGKNALLRFKRERGLLASEYTIDRGWRCFWLLGSHGQAFRAVPLTGGKHGNLHI